MTLAYRHFVMFATAIKPALGQILMPRATPMARRRREALVLVTLSAGAYCLLAAGSALQ